MVSSAYCRRETPPSYKVWDHAVNVAGQFGFVKNGREGIGHHVKQERRERVALADPTKCGEEGANLTVNVNSGPTAGDKLHNSGHPTVIKALTE